MSKLNSKSGTSVPKTPWGELGYITFKRTYARRLKENDPNSPTEEFEDTVDRVVNGAVKQLKVPFSDKEQKRFKEIMLELKGTVAGRFFWQLGTKTVDRLGLPSLQNCFREDTEFVTSGGLRSFKDFNDGDPVTIKGNLSWKPATVKQFGEQEIVELHVRRAKQTQVIHTTANHRWVVGNKFGKKQGIKTTDQLSGGSVLQHTSLKTNLHNLTMCNTGVQHGLVFGDGHYSQNAKCCAFVPCGDSADEYRKRFYSGFNGRKEITGLPNTWKDLPSTSMNKHYIYGFLAGYFAADGSVAKNGSLTLSCSKYETLNQVKGLFTLLDIYCGDIQLNREISPFDGSPATLYKMSIGRENLPIDFLILSKHKERFKEMSTRRLWKVEKIVHTGKVEPVWCVVEPDKEEFTLANGILTKNCAFTVVDEPIRPFTWAFDMLMLGSGVGYNIQREFVYKLPKVVRKKVKIERKDTNDADFIVPDSREGWGKLLGKVLKAHFYGGGGFTYSTICVRGKGTPIKGFGGTASGPEDLVIGISNICKVLEKRRGKQLRPIDCLDIMNIIGSVVVAGNVRRSAQIAIGDYDDLEFLAAKDWSSGNIPNWRAMSNNSVVCNDISKLPDQFWEGYLGNGEPYGLINLKLSQSCGRTGETQYPDPDVLGYNPCAEQSLAPFETCCLAEVHLPNISSLEEFMEVSEYLYRVNKHSLSIKCHHSETEAIVHQNMRMGIGITGYAMATKKQKAWLPKVYQHLREYDKKYSKKHGFPESIKLTTVKPSGTLSLLSGVTPGAHPGYAHHFIRRIRMASNIPLVEVCKAGGYKVEYVRNFDGSDDHGTVVVEFPCKFPKNTMIADQVSAVDQLEVVKELQSNWSDNAVSVTIYYRKEELEDIKSWLRENYNENTKSVSFLLHNEHGFDQAPYEEITEEEYKKISKNCTPIVEVEIDEDSVDDLGGCDTGACPIK